MRGRGGGGGGGSNPQATARPNFFFSFIWVQISSRPMRGFHPLSGFLNNQRQSVFLTFARLSCDR